MDPHNQPRLTRILSRYTVPDGRIFRVMACYCHKDESHPGGRYAKFAHCSCQGAQEIYLSRLRCRVRGCKEPVEWSGPRARKWCAAHRKRQQRHGRLGGPVDRR